MERIFEKKRHTRFYYLSERQKFSFHEIHISGYADLDTLKEMVSIINPKYLVPIHTFKGKSYKNIFKAPTLYLKDREEYIL